MKNFTCIASVCLVLFISCKKDHGHDDRVINIEGFHLFDASGVETGMVGGEDKDWTLVGLSPLELKVFNALLIPDIALVNTKVSNVTLLGCYPNPAVLNQTFSVVSSDTVLVRLAVVDEQLRTVISLAGRGKGQINFAFRLKDVTLNKDSSASYRLYYSFSAAGRPHFKTGYGDIRYCPNNAGNCF